MTNPPPNFKPGIGRLATDRYDFQSHLEGINPAGYTDFRHTADQTDMNPPVLGGATTVQATLADVAAFIAGQSGVGQGFITVGDGYNTWHNATPTGEVNYDPAIPSLDTLLNPIFNAMIAGQVLPANFDRIQYGGIVVIKAGTYTVAHTINVPPSITLLGEGYGTKIINATNLQAGGPPVPTNLPIEISNISNTGIGSILTVTTPSPLPTTLVTGDTVNISGASGPSTLNPAFGTGINSSWQITVTGTNTFTLTGSAYVSGTFTGTAFFTTMAPIFRIAADNSRANNDAIVDPNYFVFSRETRIMNMVICDNFVENTQLGDIDYKIPQNYTNSSNLYPPALISQKNGSSLVLDQVIMMGRAAYTGGVVSKVTGTAIGLDSTYPAPSGTILRIANTTIDGFSSPLVWLNGAGSADYLEISTSKIRGYGYYNGSASGAAFNSLFNINDCSAKITNNIIYGNYENMQNAVYVNGTVASAPAKQARGKLLVAMNDFIVDKFFAGSTSTLTFNPIGLVGGATSAYLSWMSYGNNFQDNFAVTVDAVESTGAELSVTTSGTNATSITGTNITATTNLSVAAITGTANPTPISGSFAFSATSTATFNGLVIEKLVRITGSSYTIDSGSISAGSDSIVLVATASGGVTLNLPTTSASMIGRTIVIKDGGVASGSNIITIQPHGTDTIDGNNTAVQITVPYTAITLMFGYYTGSTGSWFIV